MTLVTLKLPGFVPIGRVQSRDEESAMPAVLTYLTLAAGFALGWAIRSVTSRPQPAPLVVRTDRYRDN